MLNISHNRIDDLRGVSSLQALIALNLGKQTKAQLLSGENGV